MLAGVLLVGVGCGGGGDSDAPGPAVVVGPGITAMRRADALACGADHDTVQAAVDAFTLLEGAPPGEETDLVPGYLREPSELYDVTTSGAVVPAPGSPC
jgi:hypothetical protein